MQTRLFFFGRTDREKEDWFRRLANATHKGAHISLNQPPDPDLDVQESVSQTLLDANTIMTDYRKFMALYTKVVYAEKPFVLPPFSTKVPSSSFFL